MLGKGESIYDTCLSIFVLSTYLTLQVQQCWTARCPHNVLYSLTHSWSPSNNRDNPVVTQITQPVVHGEGPHWDPTKKVLYFVDIAGKRLYRYNPQTIELTFAGFDEDVGAVFPIQNTENKFLVGIGKTLMELTWNGENTITPCAQKLHTVDIDKIGNRFNDGKVDSVGRLWIGTMGEEKPVGNVKLFQGTLYRLSNDTCLLEPMIRNVSVSNGIAWTFDDKHMFYIDSPTRQVIQYDYDITDGSIKNGKVIFDFAKENLEGVPDGMAIDNNDDLWIACWNGSQVIKVSSHTGKLLARIKMPVPRVTSVTFGDNFQTMYVTTSMLGLSKEELQMYPLSGALFSISNINVMGHPNNAVSNCVRSHGTGCSN